MTSVVEMSESGRASTSMQRPSQSASAGVAGQSRPSHSLQSDEKDCCWGLLSGYLYIVISIFIFNCTWFTYPFGKQEECIWALQFPSLLSLNYSLRSCFGHQLAEYCKKERYFVIHSLYTFTSSNWHIPTEKLIPIQIDWLKLNVWMSLIVAHSK